MRTPRGPPAAVLPRSVSRMLYFPELWARTASQPSAQAAALALFTEKAKTRRFRIALFSARCKQNAAPPPAAAQHPQPVTASPAAAAAGAGAGGPRPGRAALQPRGPHRRAFRGARAPPVGGRAQGRPGAASGRHPAGARSCGVRSCPAALLPAAVPLGCDPVRPRSRWGAIPAGLPLTRQRSRCAPAGRCLLCPLPSS